MEQEPSSSISLMAQFTDGLEADTEYELTVHIWGNKTNMCNSIGETFNPLADPKAIVKPVWNGWTYTLPPSDYYGEIIPFRTDAEGKATLSQHSFLQNLEGDKTLIGRSIALSKKGVQSYIPIACCVIGRDIYHAPDSAAIGSGYGSGYGFGYN